MLKMRFCGADGGPLETKNKEINKSGEKKKRLHKTNEQNDLCGALS